MKKLTVTSFILVATIFMISSAAQASPVEYGVVKGEFHYQTAPGTYEAGVEYEFSAGFKDTDATAVNLVVPTATSYPFTEDSPGNFHYYDDTCSTKSALDTKYPNGTYTFNATGSSGSPYDVEMSGTFPAQKPEFVSPGVLPGDIISTLTPTFHWAQWVSPPPVVSNGRIRLEIWDQDADDDVEEWLIEDLTKTFFEIPSGILNWGTNYEVGVEFVYAGTYSLGPPEIFGVYMTATDMEFTTIPEPATMMLLGSLATGLFGIAAARRKK